MEKPCSRDHAGHGYSRIQVEKFWRFGLLLCAVDELMLCLSAVVDKWYTMQQKCVWIQKEVPSYEHDGTVFNALHRP